MTAETIEWPDVCPNCVQETEVAIVSKSKKSPTMFFCRKCATQFFGSVAVNTLQKLLPKGVR